MGYEARRQPRFEVPSSSHSLKEEVRGNEVGKMGVVQFKL